MQEWISIAEQQPPDDKPVWLYEPPGNIWIGALGDGGDGYCYGNGYGSHYYSRLSSKWELSDCEVDDDYQPTHWAELPLPPNAGNKPAARSDDRLD